MASQKFKAKKKTARKKDEVEESRPSSDKVQSLMDSMDEILDEIDSVLEENAAEFIESFVQRNGE